MNRSHASRALGTQLQHVRQSLLAVMDHVESMVWSAVLSLVSHDRTLAANVIASDDLVDHAELNIDEECLQILARHQPLAADLRLVTTALKMITDLERMGDVAVNICERALELAGTEPLVGYDDLLALAGAVHAMVHDVREAFAAGDVAKAEAVIRRDEEVDRMYRRVFGDVLLCMMSQPENVARGVHLQAAAKALERVADHAANLAEGIIYIVKGRDVRHLWHPSTPPGRAP